MAIIETSEEVIEYLKKSGKPFNQEPPHGFKKGFTYVRSIKLYVKEESHLEENCDKANKTLLGKKLRMLKIPEFIHFFNHVKIYNKKVYNNITRVRREHPWRIELLDAYFIKRKDDLYISTENRTNTEKLENALMEDRQAPGISLKSWLENPNSQGLPRPNIKRPDTKKDNLGYIHPKNNSCLLYTSPSPRDATLSRMPSSA